MPRAFAVLAASHRHDRPVADTVILDYAQRSARKIAVTGSKGSAIEIDMDEPVRLRTDDLLVLDDGSLVEVVAAPEPLIEARVADVAALARLAWHLGDRHVPVQVLANRIRAQRDPAIETLLKSLGAKLTMIEAPFEPEGGAYASSHGHSHDHDHEHDHDHGHAHGHKHHHDH
ncbi:MAG: urease accessory protein UreE [Rhizobiales bacterium]|nr:urease accessory protein UreE [Hyphomicrobiales bacterium]